MPFTYLAHQAPALAIKKRWPAWFDGTALALGSMAPDWAYALSGSRFAFDGLPLRRLTLLGARRPPLPMTVVATVFGVVAGGLWAMGDPGLPAVITRLSLGLAAGLVAGSVACRRLAPA